MRTGKIDILDTIQLAQAQSMQKTNPEIVQIPTPLSTAITIEERNDLAPFKDIKVREALQMSIDLPTIAKTYYGGKSEPWPSSLTSNFMPGWGFPYNQWPQDLKDQYAYNPTTAKKLLADAGYPNGFNTDIVVDSTVDMDLLQIVKSYFATIGVNMDIRPMDPASFSAFMNGRKQDALAQRASGSLGMGFYPIRHLLRFQFGQPPNVANVNDPVFTDFYNQALVATSTDAVKTIIINANKYVAQQHYVISLLQPYVYNFCQPWIKGYNAQYGSTQGPTGSGPVLMFTYDARFWIDQNLKHSMGH